MTTRVGINGFGRIGRTFTRLALERTDLEVVAVNDITDARTLAHLLAFDSTFGRLGATVEHTEDSLIIDGTPIAVLSERDPANIDWGKLGADVVIESTGKFRSREGAALHLKGGARKVLISAPGKGADLTVVLGVNSDAYDPAAARRDLERVLHDQLRGPDGQGAERRVRRGAGVHDHDSRLHRRPDAARRAAQDLRRARSAAFSIVPTTTGAASATGEVIPALVGKLDGVSLRVPVEDGSLTDLAACSAARSRPRKSTRRSPRPRPPARWRGSCGTAPIPSSPGTSSATRVLRVRLAADPGVRDAGQGVRLVRQRMGLHVPAGRPGRARRQPAVRLFAGLALTSGPPLRKGGPLVAVPLSAGLDAAAGDLDRDDADVDLAGTAGPWPDHGVLAHPPQLGGMGDPVRLPAHQHAPALAERLVEVIDLQRHLLVGVPLDHGALAGPDHDGVRHHGEVDRNTRPDRRPC